MTTGNRPRPVSDLVPGLTKGVFGRKNMLFGKLLTEWEHIAGPDIAARTLPLDLKFLRPRGTNKTPKTDAPPQAVLHLAVQSAYALEFSYQKGLMVEKLNSFFGYAAIQDIKIIQNSEVMNKKTTRPPKTRPLTAPEQQNIDALTGGIAESDLQTALKNLGKAIVSRQTKKV